MGYSEIVNNATQMISLVLVASLPPVIVAAVIGTLISLVQALTQVQEQTLSFAFKLIAVIITLFAMIETIGADFYLFTQHVFNYAAQLDS